MYLINNHLRFSSNAHYSCANRSVASTNCPLGRVRILIVKILQTRGDFSVFRSDDQSACIIYIYEDLPLPRSCSSNSEAVDVFRNFPPVIVGRSCIPAWIWSSNEARETVFVGTISGCPLECLSKTIELRFIESQLKSKGLGRRNIPWTNQHHYHHHPSLQKSHSH